MGIPISLVRKQKNLVVDQVSIYTASFCAKTCLRLH